MSFHNRSRIAFLVVPWMIIPFLIPIFMQEFWIGKKPLQTLIFFSILLSILTYILEFTAGLLILKYLIRKNITRFYTFVILGFIMGFIYSYFVSSLFGLGILFVMKGIGTNYFFILMFFGLVGASEAALYWLITRPDRYHVEQSRLLLTWRADE